MGSRRLLDQRERVCVCEREHQHRNLVGRTLRKFGAQMGPLANHSLGWALRDPGKGARPDRAKVTPL